MDADIISSRCTSQLLALVRAALWQRPADPRFFSGSPVDWDEIARLSMQQTVGALAIKGAMSLPPELFPTKDRLHKALAFIERNRRTHLMLDGCVAEAVARLKEAGIGAVLLKGQAYARHYPEGILRQCGDIDLYVGEDDYFRAYKVSRQQNWDSDELFHRHAKHYGCSMNGVHLELHRVAAVLPSRSADRRFQEWSREQLRAGKRTTVIGAEEISLPTPIFDAVFVFMHIYHHFISGGVGLRQLCDWVMLLHTHSGDVSRDELAALLKEFRLLRAWRRFAPIAVELLGLPESECPFYSAVYSGESDKILSFVLKEGNFGKYAPVPASARPEGYMAGKLYSFRHHSGKLFTRFAIDPVNVISYQRRYIITGVKAMMSDLLKRE